MKKQKVILGSEAREKLAKGVNILAEAVTSTLGPGGRNIIITVDGETRSTKDGVSIAKNLTNLEDPIENMGVQLVKQTAIKTADKVGDGTTTSTLLAQTIINEGLKYIEKGANATSIKKGIDLATQEVLDELHKSSKEITSEDQIEQIATISANNDIEVGKLISTALNKVGREGVVTIEESKTGETTLEVVEGMQFERGYKSPYFVTDNNTMSCVLDKPKILLYDGVLNQAKDLLPLLETVSQQNSSLVIIAEDIDGEALATLIVNKMRGTLKVCAIKAPDFGERRLLIMEDVATLTGGKVVSYNKGMRLDKFDTTWLGECRSVTVQKDQTTLVGGNGNVDDISERISQLQTQVENAKSPYEVEKLQERLAKMAGGVAIIYVGGNTEVEMKEKKDRVDDALQAAKAAILDGILPGGGKALLKARQAINLKEKDIDVLKGKEIVFKACKAPFIKIAENSGIEFEEIYSIIDKVTKNTNFWLGYNAKTEKIEDLLVSGVIDPSKVTKHALLNASSVAGTVLLTEGLIIEEQSSEQENDPYNLQNIM
jgi:chaperonin GroEL